MLPELAFAIPVASGLFIVLLLYVKYIALLGYSVPVVQYVGPRMVIPTLVGFFQVITDLPVSGGTPATQVFAWVGVSLTLTLMAEIVVLNIKSVPPPPPREPKLVPVEMLD